MYTSNKDYNTVLHAAFLEPNQWRTQRRTFGAYPDPIRIHFSRHFSLDKGLPLLTWFLSWFVRPPRKSSSNTNNAASLRSLNHHFLGWAFTTENVLATKSALADTSPLHGVILPNMKWWRLLKILGKLNQFANDSIDKKVSCETATFMVLQLIVGPCFQQPKNSKLPWIRVERRQEFSVVLIHSTNRTEVKNHPEQPDARKARL